MGPRDYNDVHVKIILVIYNEISNLSLNSHNYCISSDLIKTKQADFIKAVCVSPIYPTTNHALFNNILFGVNHIVEEKKNKH